MSHPVVPDQAGPDGERVIGIIDLGSNSLRLMLVRILPDGSHTVLNQVKNMVRLGEGAFETGHLREESMARTINVLRGMAEMCGVYGASEVIAIATAAVRDAANGPDFMRRVKEKTGIDSRVVSGREEARLIYLGVSSGLAHTESLRLFIDIGGGSTELVVGNSEEYRNLDSLKMGCVRLSNLFFDKDSGTISAKRYAALQNYIRNNALRSFQRIADFVIEEGVASSGTAQNLAEIAAALDAEDAARTGRAPQESRDVLSYGGLRRAVKELCGRTLKERRSVPGINPNRADVIVAGAAIQWLRDELRLLEEARWGVNWILRTRFGDGYRLGGLIIGIWTKNIRGDKDDMQTEARNTPTDNLKAASSCALAAPHFEKKDPVFARWCRNSAIEDFQFAIDLLDTQRTEQNETELYALATVTAMRLYRLTQDVYYLDWATRLARTVMAGQQLEKRTDWKIPLRGFFYESSRKKRILAYYHQSQEHLMAEGLSMLLTDAPTHPDVPLWKASCEAYADYLRGISQLIEPYGILPSAVYEVDNTDYKNLYHEGEQVGLPSLEEYNAQVRNGIPLSKDFYLRRFPVAYQFRGFHAVVMGKAKAAFILARLFNDKALRDIATRQVEYILGYNPFAMSTVYGDGYDYPPLYGAYAGNVVGAVPVGIETFENDDEPYFPMQNNCTYKEIWTHTTARLMWCVAELFK